MMRGSREPVGAHSHCLTVDKHTHTLTHTLSHIHSIVITVNIPKIKTKEKEKPPTRPCARCSRRAAVAAPHSVHMRAGQCHLASRLFLSQAYVRCGADRFKAGCGRGGHWTRAAEQSTRTRTTCEIRLLSMRQIHEAALQSSANNCKSFPRHGACAPPKMRMKLLRPTCASERAS